jgi:hypothetical protein
MRKSILLFCITALLSACGNEKATDTAATGKAVVKSAAAPVAEPAPDSATMMKNWQEYMTPGKEHQMMAAWNGTWKGEVTSWMTPEAKPSHNSGTVVNKMVLGGRYQQGNFKGSFDGMPFEGLSMLAYDHAKKVFVSTWIDNMGTGIMTMEGPWDEASKSITFKGKIIDPSLKKETDVKEVFRVVDANTQVMEMYARAEGGKEFKTMEIKYTRPR